MSNYLVHYGIPGQKWGNRRFQNEDGSLTPAGERRYYTGDTGSASRAYVSPEYQQEVAYNSQENVYPNQGTSGTSSNRPSSRVKVVGSGSVTASVGNKLENKNGTGTGTGRTYWDKKASENAIATMNLGKKYGQNLTAYQLSTTPNLLKPKPKINVDELLNPSSHDGNTTETVPSHTVTAPTSQNYNVVPQEKPANSQKTNDKATAVFNALKTITVNSLIRRKEFAEKVISKVASVVQKLLKKK